MDTSQSSLIERLFWSPDPGVQSMAIFVILMSLVAIAAVYVPLAIHLVKVALLQSSLVAATHTDGESLKQRRDRTSAAFQDSPLVGQWQEFLRRWRAGLADGLERASGGGVERSAVRLMDVLDERPLVPPGIRISLLSHTPLLLVGVGAFGSFASLAGATYAGFEIADALPPVLWGLAFGLLTALSARLIEGRFAYHALCLDLLAQRVYGALSDSELATRAVFAQRDTVDRMQDQLKKVTLDISGSMADGLRRIETSMAQAASLVSEEQRGSLRSVVEELRTAVRRGVDTHLGELHDALGRAVQHQDDVSTTIARNYERMLEAAESNDRVAATLDRAADAVAEATTSISETAVNMSPLLEHLRDTGTALEQAATHMQSTQEASAKGAESVQVAVERAAEALGEQRGHVETGLREIRLVVEGLSEGLGANLTQSLSSVDAILSGAVERIRETIEETQRTVDRLGEPIRSAETTNREMHAALERVRVDIGSVSQWLVQAVEPVRTTLANLDDHTAGISRGLLEFSHRADLFEKTIESLRGAIGEGGASFQSASGDLASRMDSVIRVLGQLDGSGESADSPAVRTEAVATATPLAVAEPEVLRPPPSPRRFEVDPDEVTADPALRRSPAFAESTPQRSPLPPAFVESTPQHSSSPPASAESSTMPVEMPLPHQDGGPGGLKRLGADPWSRLAREQGVSLADLDDDGPESALGSSLLKGSPPPAAPQVEDSPADDEADITYRQLRKKD